MRKAATLFTDPKITADTKNYAGFPAWTPELEDHCLSVLLTGVFENTFYAEQSKLVQEAVEIFQQMAKKDPKLLAQMIVYARNKGLLRTVPITALVILSTASPEYFKLAFQQTIRTPNDLKDFVEIVKNGNLRKGLGRSLKTAIASWMNRMSEYHAIKYGSDGSDLSLRDILRIVHPQPKTSAQDVLFSYLVNGIDETNRALVDLALPQIAAFERLKKSTEGPEQLRLIAEGRLPYETVVGAIKPDTKLWTELMKQMPYMALLRHLNTLAKAGVFQDKTNVAYVVERLTNPQAVARSMVLPFRFFTTHNMLTPDMPRAIFEALEIALELSFQNMPALEGTVCIAPDVSGSMSSYTAGKSKTRCIDIGAIFAAACLKKSQEGIVLPFEGDVVKVKLSARDSLMTIARTMADIGGGSTCVGAPIRQLLQKQQKVDTFIGLTDCEDWNYGGWRSNGSFVEIWREYRRQVNPNAKAFLVTLVPYGHKVTPPSEPGVYYIYGFSDSVLAYIAHEAKGVGSQMEEVRSVSLGEAPKPPLVRYEEEYLTA